MKKQYLRFSLILIFACAALLAAAGNDHKIAFQDRRKAAEVNTTVPAATDSIEWVDLPGMSVTIDSTGYPVLVLAQISGVQVMGSTGVNNMGQLRGPPVTTGHFQVLLVGKKGEKDQVVSHAVHETALGSSRRDVCMNAVLYPGAGKHTIKVQWRRGEAPPKGANVPLNTPGPDYTRSLIATELVFASDVRDIRKTLHKAVLEAGRNYDDIRAERKRELENIQKELNQLREQLKELRER